MTAPRPVLAVGGVVFAPSPEGMRVLLIRRGRAPNVGRWSLPGGRVELEERLATATAREVLEETGIEVEVGPLIEVVEILEPPYHYVVLDYLCVRRASETNAAPRAGDDASEAAFVLVSELGARGCTELVVKVVARALAMSARG
jgi:8-oxo-dGTP diphosphatase